MKKISFWAKKHKWLARLIITAINVTLLVIGFKTGYLLNDLDISIPFILLLAALAAFIMAAFWYPARFKRNYAQQKTCDIILAASSFCMIVYFGNHDLDIFQTNNEIKAALIHPVPKPGDPSAKTYKSITEFRASLKNENGKSLGWKEKRKLLKQQIKGIKKAKDVSDAGKVGLIVLSVLVALGLLGLLGALSCSISCGGADGLALVVFLLGTGVIIFFLVRVIRSIEGKKRKKHQDRPVD